MKDVLGFLVMCLIAVFVVPPILEWFFGSFLGFLVFGFLAVAFFPYQ